MRIAFVIIGVVATLGSAAGAQRAVDWSRIDLDAERAAIGYFQSQDQRLQDIGWKLARGNADFCDGAIPSIGLQLQDMASYGSPAVARRALALQGDFAVQTAAKGSPAALSGAFPANREISAIGETNPNEWEAGRRFHWQRLTRAHDLIDVTLRAYDEVAIAFVDGERAGVTSVPVCPSRFELLGKGKKAVADGKRVVIGIDYPAFKFDEAEFASLVAHELAHNVLGHTAWLNRNGRKRSNTRLTEREADRLIPWLLANAGYEPKAAARFFQQLRPSSGSLLFIKGTHPRWRQRAASVEGEIPLIKELMAREGKADWRAHFTREIDPNKGLAE